MRGLTGALLFSISLVSLAARTSLAAAEAAPPAPGPSAVAPATVAPQPPSGYPPPPGYPAPPPGPGYPPQPYPYAYPQPGGVPAAYYRRPPKPGFHEHDGLYVRLFLGGGYLGASASEGGADYDIHGAGGGFGAAVGAAVVENLILYGELTFFDVPGPTMEAGGVSRVASGESMVLVGLGPGVTYYVMPINIYLSATIGLSKLNLEESSSDSSATNNLIASTRWGLGVSLKAGKELWVSHNWGLGVALQYQFGSMADNTVDPAPQFHAHGFSVVGSATFN